MNNDYPFTVPPAPTDKKRIIFSFGENDSEFFKCFPSDFYLGTQYDVNPAQLMIVWDVFLNPYHCELLIFDPRNQLLVSVPVPKNVNVPYTILDGMLTEWVTREEFVYFQFVFTRDGNFVKSTLPIRMNFSPANKPKYFKLVKPLELDRMKELSDKAVVTASLRFDDANGWTYDFYSLDGTLRFSLGWIPNNVVMCVEQRLSANEKMTARANLNVPTTFVLPVSADEGVNLVKDVSEYVNSLEDASIEVWEEASGLFSLVTPVGISYSGSLLHVQLSSAISGKIRVQCKSSRYIPSGDSVLLESVYSGNALIDESGLNLLVKQEMKE